MNLFLSFLVTYPGVAVTAILIPLLALRWFLTSDAASRQHTEWLLVCAALIQPANSVALITAGSLSRLCPLKLDLYIFDFDRLFGEPSFALGQLAAAHPWLQMLSSLSYGLLSTAIFAAVAAYIMLREAREARFVATAFALNLFLAVPLFLICPVCGPAYAFRSFPALPADSPGIHSLLLHAAPNGVPSVHMATALLVVFFFWSWPRARAAALLFAALTAFATLSSGEHYLFDLLMSVPYAFLVVQLTVEIEVWLMRREAARAVPPSIPRALVPGPRFPEAHI